MNKLSVAHDGLDEAIARCKISDVYQALGGPKPRRGRARRPGGDNDQALSFNDSKGAWFDHVAGEGGGVIALVMRMMGCSKADAVRWLSDYTGVEIGRPWTEAERREYARKWRAAEAEAAALVDWKFANVETLRSKRNELLEMLRLAKRFLFDHSADECFARAGIWIARWECSWWVFETYDARINALQKALDRIEGTSYDELLPLFRAGQDWRQAA